MRRLKEIHKVQELVFRLKTSDAKASDVVILSPDTMMSEVRAILRKNKIAAAPIVAENKVLGIISVNDYLNWLTAGREDCRVEKCMSLNVKFLYDDEPLTDAIKCFDRYGFYEFPIIDRKNGNFAGIITRRDIIMGILRALEIDYHEMEISRYSGHTFFHDIVADRTEVILSFTVEGKNIQRGGEVASKLKKNLQQLGLHPGTIRKTVIATYEAEMNLIIYGEGGWVDVLVDAEAIHIEVKDEGPGIPDIQKVLQPGYSTAPDWVRELGFGAGMGFTNIQNCSDVLDIISKVGEGTTVKIRIGLDPEKSNKGKSGGKSDEIE